ncbi:MAG: membrane protein insertion efficiency factor YidD [Chloroflexi bacterium]|jgi:putative membrane protein insertion efficiency factor|nr:MAG: hypothetical protein UZ13_01469 [Chloroflexi bacterium OLB13]MBC6955853.1 membrane protein insertion efficiency factor YidD [Chloroflexota bacterium]MBW7877692.1 membrane protein insertion efficiency factor YidD [Anaerolineae bacterium]MDL1916208.1 membrane protein insertion efficiency factor YidD [Anaerolineae bacterium CFX4]OQY86165.1 MAG: membrane protein insertion efficiency factor YidD [Anaerolineae bacterium UTCFX5]
MKFLALAAIRFYKRRISPLLPPSCRFYPTCSEYMYEAIQVHGLIRGGWMGLKRIGRCNPFNPGGFDPVPPKKEHAKT